MFSPTPQTKPFNGVSISTNIKIKLRLIRCLPKNYNGTPSNPKRSPFWENHWKRHSFPGFHVQFQVRIVHKIKIHESTDWFIPKWCLFGRAWVQPVWWLWLAFHCGKIAKIHWVMATPIFRQIHQSHQSHNIFTISHTIPIKHLHIDSNSSLSPTWWCPSQL